MTVAYDAHTAFTLSADTGSTTHTPVGTPTGVIVAAWGVGTTWEGPQAISYGGVQLRKLTWGRDYSTELSSLSLWVLDRLVPAGAQTVAVSFAAGNVSTRQSVSWRISIITVTGNGNGIVVKDIDHISSQNGTVGANPSLAMDSGNDTALRLGYLISGHNSSSSHAVGSGFTNVYNGDEASNASYRVQRETTPSSGSTDVGMTLTDDDGVFAAIAVADDGPQDGVIHIGQSSGGPIGLQTDIDRAIGSVTPLEEPMGVFAAVVNVTNTSDVVAGVDFGSSSMVEALNISGGSGRRVQLFYLIEDVPFGSSQTLTLRRQAPGSTSIWVHAFWIVAYANNVLEVGGTDQLSNNPGQTYFTTFGSGSAGTPSLDIIAGQLGWGTYTGWENGSVDQVSKYGLGAMRGAWDNGSDMSYLNYREGGAGNTFGHTDGSSDPVLLAGLSLTQVPTPTAGGCLPLLFPILD